MPRTALHLITIIICFAYAGYGCAIKPAPSQDTAIPGFALYDPYRVFLARQDQAVAQAFVYRARTQQKVVALTFDDGPTADARKIVDVLQENFCPATFFLIAGKVNGDNLEPYRDELFEIGLHGYEHKNFALYDRAASFDQVHFARQAMHELGFYPRYFRPPYGVIDANLQDALQTQGLAGILWSLDSFDWNNTAGGALVERVVTGASAGDIILLHECPATTEALPMIIEGIRARGFHIVPLELLLHFPRQPFSDNLLTVKR